MGFFVGNETVHALIMQRKGVSDRFPGTFSESCGGREMVFAAGRRISELVEMVVNHRGIYSNNFKSTATITVGL
jgi:hypothetical protein